MYNQCQERFVGGDTPRFLERKRRKELYILFRDISEDIFTKKQTVLDGTYCKKR